MKVQRSIVSKKRDKIEGKIYAKMKLTSFRK